jgi:hypothetical protein
MNGFKRRPSALVPMLAESDRPLTSRMHAAYMAVAQGSSAYGWFDYLEIFETLERSMILDPRDADQVNVAVGIHTAVLDIKYAASKEVINQPWFEETYRRIMQPTTTPCLNPRD